MARADLAALSGSLKALIISPNKTLAAELSALLAQHLPHMPVFEMQSYPAKQVLFELSGAAGPNLCLLDLISDLERGLALIAELLAVQPAMKIVVLLPSKNPDIILRAMRQGAAEFLVRPFEPEELDHAIERIVLLQKGENNGRQGRLIAVVPSKGACGATTIAANLAQHYRRAGFQKILLADLDPLTGTLSFLLKIKSNYSFLDALSRAGTLDADIWRGIVASRGGIDILLSPESVQEGLHDLRDASAILEFARQAYEVAVLDAASVYGEWNLAIMRQSDDVVMVTTNELPALQATQRALTYLEANRIARSKIRLVVNRYNKELGLSREVIETALHIDVFHIIAEDYDSVSRALMEGKPVAPGSTFGKNLAQMAERLLPRPQAEASAARKTSALSSLFSLFSKSAAR